MGAGYVRQSTADIQTGKVVLAAPINNEFNALQSAFDGSTGHSHDGTTGEGQQINLTTSVTGSLPLANGGTGGTDAATGRTGLGLGTAAIVNTGTSGATIPLLNGTNTWANQQTFSAAPMVSMTNPYFYLNASATTGQNVLWGLKTGVSRWAIIPGNSTAESGSNVGSDLYVNRYTDAGAYIDSPFIITRSTGIVTVGQGIAFGGTAAATTRTNMGLGTAAIVNTGTSGATIPLLSTSNTWSASQILPSIVINNTAGTQRSIYFQTGGVTRWEQRGANGTTESGSNVGSDWQILRYNDAGTFVDVPFQITRSTGLISQTATDFTGQLQVRNNAQFVINGTVGNNRTALFQTSGSNRWGIDANSTAESGSQAGSDFRINRYNDSGTFVDTSLGINRASGIVTTTNGLITPQINGAPLDGDGYRNKLINGDFLNWQRALSQSTGGYGSADRWVLNLGTSTTGTLSRVALAPSDAIFGYGKESQSMAKYTITSTGNAASGVAMIEQRIENVRTLNARVATLTFWAQKTAAGAISVDLLQNFGSGGSANVIGIGTTKFNLSANTWTKCTVAINVPNINGKSFGTGSTYLSVRIWFNAGTDYNTQTNSLGQSQSGDIYISRVSLVEGDATAETDPFISRHYSQEIALCQRYYETGDGWLGAYADTASRDIFISIPFKVLKRTTPSLGYITGSASNASIFEPRNPTASGLNWYIRSTAAGAVVFNGNWTADAEI